jgi:crotonobetainyl-CoA:carnitine CoA-transferase CaiB-like acyl-CoA transferase
MSGPAANSPGALSGVRILDLGRVVAPELAAQIMGDMGADVVKVERPGRGDDARHYPQGRIGASCEGDAAVFIACNRNKRSVTVDLSKREGQDLVRQLAAQSDILLENYKPGTLQRYGLDYASLATLNPKLVYCSVSGYGQQGPYASRAGLDPIFQAQTGFMRMNGEELGDPVATPVVVDDIVTAYNVVMAVLAALRERDQVSGAGQHVDLALFDCGVAFMTTMAQEYFNTGRQPPRVAKGGLYPGATGRYRCADGDLVIMLSRDHHFAGLCKVLGCEQLMRDPRFVSMASRTDHGEALGPLIAERVRRWKLRELADALAAQEVPAGEINDFDAVFGDRHSQQRGLAVELPHPHDAKLRVLANPARFSRSAIGYRRPPPLLGEHTDEVLRERLGLSDAALAALRASRVI